MARCGGVIRDFKREMVPTVPLQAPATATPHTGLATTTVTNTPVAAAPTMAATTAKRTAVAVAVHTTPIATPVPFTATPVVAAAAAQVATPPAPIAKLNVRLCVGGGGGGGDQPAGRQTEHISFVVHPEPMQCPRWTVLGALESV